MRSVLSCIFAFTVMGMASAQLDPVKALASMKPGDGLQVELFAAEPMVINPTNMDIDPLGRVWVTEAVNYRCKLRGRPLYRPEGDRVVILTDKDGDGKADEASTFYQGKELQAPLGICIVPFTNKDAKNGIGYRVLVSQSPDILEFWDKDGDGKADGPPTVFLAGFGGIDHDHGVHSIQVGPDGKFYFTVGDQGVKNLQSRDGKGKKWSTNDTDCQKGTVWRCDPDGNNLELIAHNFRNQYEACVDSFGEIWLSDNDDDGSQQTRICHVLPGGNYGYGPRGPGQSHWHEEQPGIVHKTLRTGFGSPTGICFYEGNLLPKQYQGDMIHCDAGPREVRYFKRIPKGAGYELEKSLMLTSSDSWFRPSDVCVAPDGSVMVADWYDPGVGGHGMGDTTRGRIYRLTPTRHKGYKVPEVNIDTKQGLLAAIESPNLAVRASVRDYLLSMEIKDAKAKLLAAWNPTNTSTHKARFLWFANQVSIDINYPQQPNSDGMGFMHLIVFRIFDSYWSSKKVYAEMGTKIVTTKAHPNFLASAPFGIGREILVLMRRADDTQAIQQMFYAAAKHYDGQDIFFRAALNIACGTDPARRDAILADFEKHFPEWNDNVADLVWELRPKSMMPKLTTLLNDAKLSGTQKARIVDILASSTDPAMGKTLLAMVKSDAAPEVKFRVVENMKLFLPNKWAELKKSDEMRAVITHCFSTNAHIFGLQLAAVAPDCCQFEDLEKVATNKTLHEEVRREALLTCGKIRNVKLTKFLATQVKDKDLSAVAFRAVANQITNATGDAVSLEAMKVLTTAVEDKTATAEWQVGAVEAMAGTRVGTQWLIKQQEDKKLRPELVADAGRLLRNSPFQGERNKAMILFPAPGKLDMSKLPTPAELAKKTGNVENGQRIMASSLKGETQCLKCHAVRGTGGQIGPDLSMIGKKASKENLFESIIQPSKAIADQYVQWRVVTKDEQVIVGLLVGETANQITIRDANGKDTVLATTNVETKAKVPTSIMPEDLVKTLTVDELIDMVAYLQTLQTPAYTPASWAVTDTVIDGNDAVKLLDNTTNAKVQANPVRPSANGQILLPGTAKQIPCVNTATAIIESPADQTVTILFGHNGAAKVTVNDAVMIENKQIQKEVKPEQLRWEVKLKKGANTITVKVAQDEGAPAFVLTITSEQELKGK